MDVAELYRVQSLEAGSLIELLLPDTIDPVEFDELNEGMLAHIGGPNAPRKWVMDFTGVRYMGSAMLGLIVNVRQRVKSGGGTLVLCGLSKPLLEIFHTSSMERLFTIVKTRPDAIKVIQK